MEINMRGVYAAISDGSVARSVVVFDGV